LLRIGYAKKGWYHPRLELLNPFRGLRQQNVSSNSDTTSQICIRHKFGRLKSLTYQQWGNAIGGDTSRIPCPVGIT